MVKYSWSEKVLLLYQRWIIFPSKNIQRCFHIFTSKCRNCSVDYERLLLFCKIWRSRHFTFIVFAHSTSKYDGIFQKCSILQKSNVIWLWFNRTHKPERKFELAPKRAITQITKWRSCGKSHGKYSAVSYLLVVVLAIKLEAWKVCAVYRYLYSNEISCLPK